MDAYLWYEDWLCAWISVICQIKYNQLRIRILTNLHTVEQNASSGMCVLCVLLDIPHLVLCLSSKEVTKSSLFSLSLVASKITELMRPRGI